MKRRKNSIIELQSLIDGKQVETHRLTGLEAKRLHQTAMDLANYLARAYCLDEAHLKSCWREIQTLSRKNDTH